MSRYNAQLLPSLGGGGVYREVGGGELHKHNRLYVDNGYYCLLYPQKIIKTLWKVVVSLGKAFPV